MTPFSKSNILDNCTEFQNSSSYNVDYFQNGHIFNSNNRPMTYYRHMWSFWKGSYKINIPPSLVEGALIRIKQIFSLHSKYPYRLCNSGPNLKILQRFPQGHWDPVLDNIPDSGPKWILIVEFRSMSHILSNSGFFAAL